MHVKSSGYWRSPYSSYLHRIAAGHGMPASLMARISFLDWWMGLRQNWDIFSLSELKAARGPLGLPIERDLYYQPKTLQELLDMHKRQKY